MELTSAFLALLSRFSIKINIDYKKVETKQILRIEHDRFEICIPQKEKIKVGWIVPKTRIIHRKANDEWDIDSLWW
jgi:hypothetical protein